MVLLVQIKKYVVRMVNVNSFLLIVWTLRPLLDQRDAVAEIALILWEKFAKKMKFVDSIH